MNEVLASLAEIARRGTTGALCTIIKTKGPTPRKEFCSPEFVPDANDYIHCKLEDLPAKYVFSDQTAVVLATRNNKVDITGLPEILAEPSAYIGVISSQRRWKLVNQGTIN